MAGWEARVEQLLYEGETVEESVSVEDSTLVVTSHRVLLFTPEADGPNFRGVERPNVVGASEGVQDEKLFLLQAIKVGGFAVALLLVGVFIDFDALVGGVDLGIETSAGLGIGGILSLIQSMLAFVAMLDELALLFGALLLLLTSVILGVYAWTREQTLVVEVAGEDDIHLPLPEDDAVLRRVQGALSPEGVDGPIPDDPLAE